VREIPDHYLDERGGSRPGDRAAEAGPGVGWGRADISGSAPASGFRSERPADATSLPAAGARASQIDNPFVTPKAAPAARPRGLDPAAIRVGDRIRHANFGEGKILRLDPVAGDAILLIEFDRVGQKRMLAQQNALEKI
jgi:DNA helicase-2/ATP-dependent DNA helicase PcrA